MPKKVVQVGSQPPSQASQQPTGQPSQGGGGPRWAPTPESKQQSTTFRIFALVLWAVAIAGELFAIFYLLKQSTINMVWLIGAIVVIALLAVAGDFLWKRANQLDPASESEPTKFFIQNQLGAIIGIVAFLPLIILILTNKNMNQQQKGIASAVGVVALVIATLMGVTFNPPSTEQYAATGVPGVVYTAVPQANQTPAFPAESAAVIKYTGKDLVFWTKAGTVYHLCAQVSDLQHESKDNTIYSGTVNDAHANNKDRLTLKVDEELKQCGLTGAATPTTPKK